MALQMIFCMETNKKANTDYVYIHETLDRFYKYGNQVKIRPLYMKSKSKYNSNRLRKEIEKLTRDYKPGVTEVFYCIDTDCYEKDPNQRDELDNITSYCKKENYQMIWFCHNVEEVYLGKSISDTQKVTEAGRFRNNKVIQKLSEAMLSSECIRVRASNILLILDKFLERK